MLYHQFCRSVSWAAAAEKNLPWTARRRCVYASIRSWRRAASPRYSRASARSSPFDARAGSLFAQQAGVDFLVLDQTRPAIEAPLVRVIVPGLRHFYRGFAPGRVYNVPVNLRWCDRPLSEHELNAIHPHT